MRTLINGKIERFVPYFNGLVDKEGILNIQESGDFSLTVDTGFNGGIALPENLLNQMDIEFIDFEIFRLTTGEEVELPIYWGKVIVGGIEFETWFIPGDLILGMEFLSLIGSYLSFDFKRGRVELKK